MEITEVNIRLVSGDKLQGVASITIENEFVVHDLRIIDGQKGLFVAMPSRKLPNGEYKDVAHPINNEFREVLQKKVLEEFEKVKARPPEAPAE